MIFEDMTHQGELICSVTVSFKGVGMNGRIPANFFRCTRRLITELRVNIITELFKTRVERLYTAPYPFADPAEISTAVQHPGVLESLTCSVR